MQTDQLINHVSAYNRWKHDLIQKIKAYQSWLDAHDLSNPEDDLRIYEALNSLEADRLTVAFVAEFSRGKTELINALFFSDYKRRLLPSQAGRTTMCPTELLYDDSSEAPYIRLLPIETRKQDRSISDYKKHTIEWTSIPLDTSSADNLAASFEEVTHTKRVTIEEARALGLYDAEQFSHLTDQGVTPSHIDVPKWRHAIISFPHPLLKEGLVVLDTPGLNALGTEPELTLNMLPNAQGILFVLAADTGVTQSDMEMWRQHLKGCRDTHNKGFIVALNKIDTLWDEMSDADTIQLNINKQCRDTAEQLQIPNDQIFPISAQKGLLAHVKDDNELLNRSGIPKLVASLFHDVLPEKHTIIRESVLGEITAIIEQTRLTLETRLNDARKQQNDLKALSGKNADVIDHLLKKTRDEQILYNKNVEKLQTSRRILERYTRELLGCLDVNTLDSHVAETRKAMTGSWTTAGMKSGMKTFFDSCNATISEASEKSENIRKIVISIFDKFHEDHGFNKIEPKVFTTMKYTNEMARLYKDAEEFRKSPVTTMTEQSFVVKKFFIGLVSHARNVFYKSHQDAERWSKAVLAPIIVQIKEHKQAIETRLDTLRKISQSRETIESRIHKLEDICADLDSQLETIDDMLAIINQPYIEEPLQAKARVIGQVS